MSIEAMKQALEKATEVMEAACIRVDELKAENESLRQAIAEAEKQEPKPCPTCEALARTVLMDQTGRDA